ncbi:DUF3237 family protein [Campylobacter sp. RM9344]|uniref:DUF3237 family protein n=1 Tax=Campylobacter californiensis TaxID=1032243 RepID=A0AAW3ZXU9_9BACT|nr:DUF3237 family protein [Campylobacter sp. RM6883]MBE2985942.1 DUF3237 family protein [Campylobacter sp. RM12919]MBE2988143.1 DUF3237 family protein [Campylobacter sp. RM12920]MBE2994829.1 DUF3237 family protein [Campylobacter sp. RM6913]MBE3029395.1 DUF3237 family protein [Campylobacter sp. RM9344]MBE3607960.1 DUF3237 family protein [Campylobacter sp. RM9337]QCD50763.1 putative DUF3237 domain protein [Campylobacter sp. RM6914]
MIKINIKFLIFTFISIFISGCANVSHPTLQEPKLKYTFSILINSNKERLCLGDNERIFVPFTLKVSGKINGVAMPYGVDIQKQKENGIKEISARYAILLDDGETIYIQNEGMIHKKNDGSRYFVTVPKFEAYSKKYKWIQQAIFIGYAVSTPQGTLLSFYELK